MFLKRFLMTALGALGLGALAAGTVSAQSSGNIPVPDVFNDQTTCSMNIPSSMNTPTPSVVPMGAMTSPLDDLIGMGTVPLDSTNPNAATLPNLGYVIPAEGSNCGLGSGMNPFVPTGMNADGDPAEGAIPFDVAAGYSELLTNFEAVYGDPSNAMDNGLKGALDSANEALGMAIAMGTMGAALTPFEDAVTRADEAYQKALATFNAAAGGPIYQAGVAEWMAQAAVNDAVADYNTQITATTAAQTNLNGMFYADDYTGSATPDAADSLWVPLGNTELFDGTDAPDGSTPVVAILNGMGTVNHSQLVQYANGNLNALQVGMAAVPGMGMGDGSGTGHEAPVASNTDDSNFDAAGNLIIPMEANTATADDLTDLRRTTSATNSVSAIRMLVENANIAAAVLKEARDNNIGLNQEIYDEAYRRAQVEADYYNARWAEVLAYNRDTRTSQQKLEFLDDGTGGGTTGNGINEPGETNPNNSGADAYIKNPVTIAARNAKLVEEQNKRFMREQGLRTAVSTREMATATVREKFTDPQAFYNQLVARRTALKAAADKAVADATTPTMTQINTQENAAKALAEANTKKVTVDALFDDPNDPTQDLVKELLKGDDDGDDGQALVTAISSNYDDINALTAEDDPATLEDETGRITQLENTVSMLTGGDDGSSGLGALEDKVNALTAMDDPETMENENGAVTQNAADISRVDGDLRNLEVEVDDNSDDLDQVWMDLNGTPRGVEAQHEGLAACEATGTINVANCADARSRHNEAAITDIGTDIDDVNDKLGQKKEYIENLGAAIGVDPVTGEGTGEDGMSRVDMNAKAIADEAETRMAEDGKLGDRITNLAGDGRTDETVMGNAKAIADEAETRMAEDGKLGDRITNLAGDGRTDETVMGNAKAIADEAETRMAEDGKLGDRIDKESEARMAADKAEMDARMAADKAEMDARVAADEAEMNARMAADKAEMDARMMADDALGGRIDAEAMARSDADMALGMRIDGEAMARADGDVMLATAIEEAVAAGAAADMALGGRISSNADAIASNMNSIGQNRSMINDNRNMIGELSDDLDVVRAGVAASMALAGMPAINGRGIAIGVGSYDGESAFAVGFQIQGEQASFKVGVTSSGGETGASAGVGFNF